MGWMQKLCEAYDNTIGSDQSNETSPLIPVGFTQKKVTYRLVLAPDGSFVSAAALPSNQLLMMPTLPKAESRTGSGAVPFPLTEQLKYLVGGNETDSEYFIAYQTQLEQWCRQPEAPACLQAVWNYLQKKTILEDIKTHLPKFSYSATEEKAFVCFSMQGLGDLCALPEVQQSWSRHLEQQDGRTAFCYMEGKVLPLCEKHPKVQGNAKLISSKDDAFPFQYKGRFTEESGAATVSYTASAKAHNALAWLIARQGLQRYGMTWVVWNTNGCKMQTPLEEKDEDEDEDDETEGKPPIDTFAPYAEAVREAALGYRNRLRDYNEKRTNEAVILGMTAATDGRMSILYYQELPGNDYVDRLEAWYRSCCWWQFNKQKKMEIGTPRIRQLAKAILGTTTVELADKDKRNETTASKLMRELQTRLLACISDKKSLSDGLVQSAFHRSCEPLTFTGKGNRWSKGEWENCLRAACAVIHHTQVETGGTVFHPELDREAQDRSYLYGRLLAVADKLERDARTGDIEKNPQTHAIRRMSRFAQRPFDTWLQLHNLLLPYLASLDTWAGRYQNLLGEIESRFTPEDRSSTAALGWTFLQGFSSQTQALYQKKVEKEQENGQEDSEDQPTPFLYALPVERNELYGCLLGIADAAEVVASDFKRTGRTNALQLLRSFTVRPLDTWPRLHDKLVPYLEKLVDPEGKGRDYQALFGLVARQFAREDRESFAALDSRVLYGYYQMRRALLPGGGGVIVKDVPPAVCLDGETTREALFGQLLGMADHLERSAQRFSTSEIRPTNALRLMVAVGQKPESGWKYLKQKLEPYRNRLKTKLGHDSNRVEQLEEELIKHGWMTNEKLNGSYLHVYYTKR